MKKIFSIFIALLVFVGLKAQTTPAKKETKMPATTVKKDISSTKNSVVEKRINKAIEKSPSSKTVVKNPEFKVGKAISKPADKAIKGY